MPLNGCVQVTVSFWWARKLVVAPETLDARNAGYSAFSPVIANPRASFITSGGVTRLYDEHLDVGGCFQPSRSLLRGDGCLFFTQ